MVSPFFLDLEKLKIRITLNLLIWATIGKQKFMQAGKSDMLFMEVQVETSCMIKQVGSTHVFFT